MNIAVDLDDVTVAIMDGLISYHNNKFNTNFVYEDHNRWDLDKIWGCTPEEAMKRVYDFYGSNFMELLLPIEGAIDGIKKISKKHTISFITSRPTFLEQKTKRWIKHYLPNYNFITYFTNQYTPHNISKLKKSDICKKLNINLIIDDAPVNALDCASNNIRVLLFTRPWNTEMQNNEYITRVNSWKEIVKNLA